MVGTTTGADILKPLLQCLGAMNLNLSILVSTTNDRATSMVQKICVVSLLQNHVNDRGINNDISLIHQEA